jgi:hypothetical protein
VLTLQCGAAVDLRERIGRAVEGGPPDLPGAWPGCPEALVLPRASLPGTGAHHRRAGRRLRDARHGRGAASNPRPPLASPRASRRICRAHWRVTCRTSRSRRTSAAARGSTSRAWRTRCTIAISERRHAPAPASSRPLDPFLKALASGWRTSRARSGGARSGAPDRCRARRSRFADHRSRCSLRRAA